MAEVKVNIKTQIDDAKWKIWQSKQELSQKKVEEQIIKNAARQQALDDKKAANAAKLAEQQTRSDEKAFHRNVEFETRLNQLRERGSKQQASNFDRMQDKRFRALQQELKQEEKRTFLRNQDNKTLASQLGIYGHLAQAGGFYKLGHILRAGSVLENSGMSVSLPALAAIGVVGAALTGLAVVVGHVASSFASAIGEIGKAKSLSEMIVQSVNAEHEAAVIAGGTNLHGGDVLAMAERMSKGTNVSKNDMLANMKAYRAKTGEINTFGQLGTLPADLHALGMENVGGFLGQLKAENPDLSPNRLTLAAKNLWALGQSGGLDISDPSSIAAAISQSHLVRHDAATGIVLNSGIAALFNKGLGTNNGGMVLSRLEQRLVDTPNKFAGLGLGNYLKEDPEFGKRFTNIEGTLSHLAMQARLSPEKLRSSGFKDQDIRALGSLYNQSENQFTAGMSAFQREKIISDNIEALQNGTKAMDEWDGTLKEITQTTQYKLQTSFNKLYAEVGPKLADAVTKLTPLIGRLIDDIAAHPESIQKFLNAMVSVAGVMTSVAEKLGNAYNVVTDHPFAAGAGVIAGIATTVVTESPQAGLLVGAATTAAGAKLGETLSASADTDKQYIPYTDKHIEVLQRIEQNTRNAPASPPASPTGQ
jgi:hypothetical protein